MNSVSWSIWISLSNFNFGYFLNEVSVLWYVNPCIYNWEEKDQSNNIWATQMNACFAIIFSVITGYLINFGRRRMLLISNAIVVISSWILMIDSLPALIIGRILRGVVTGIVWVTVPVFINEISIKEYRAAQIGLTQQLITVGVLTALSISFLIPVDATSDSEDFCDDIEGDYVPWRLVFAIPIIPAVIQTILLWFVYRKDYYPRSKVHTHLIFFRRRIRSVLFCRKSIM